jgi:hypothetical protein
MKHYILFLPEGLYEDYQDSELTPFWFFNEENLTEHTCTLYEIDLSNLTVLELATLLDTATTSGTYIFVDEDEFNHIAQFI